MFRIKVRKNRRLEYLFVLNKLLMSFWFENSIFSIFIQRIWKKSYFRFFYHRIFAWILLRHFRILDIRIHFEVLLKTSNFPWKEWPCVDDDWPKKLPIFIGYWIFDLFSSVWDSYSNSRFLGVFENHVPKINTPETPHLTKYVKKIT